MRTYVKYRHFLQVNPLGEFGAGIQCFLVKLEGTFEGLSSTELRYIHSLILSNCLKSLVVTVKDVGYRLYHTKNDHKRLQRRYKEI